MAVAAAERRANTYERARADRVRSSMVDAGRRAESEWEGELEQRVGDLGMKIRAPDRLERVAKRHGGGYKSRQKGDYDWFYELHPKEQARIRANWMTPSSTAPTVDEIEERIPIQKWLQTTRAVDMARAMQTGRHIAGERYGGMKPGALIEGEPYDVGEVHHADRERAGRHVRQARSKVGGPVNPRNTRRGIAYKADGSLDVQFFTDPEGIVHPIRASYQTESTAERHERERRYSGPIYNPRTGRHQERKAPVYDDEPF